jgi:hypothetical protein
MAAIDRGCVKSREAKNLCFPAWHESRLELPKCIRTAPTWPVLRPCTAPANVFTQSRPTPAGRERRLSGSQLPIQIRRAALGTHPFQADDLGFASVANALGPADVKRQRFRLAQVEA